MKRGRAGEPLEPIPPATGEGGGGAGRSGPLHPAGRLPGSPRRRILAALVAVASGAVLLAGLIAGGLARPVMRRGALDELRTGLDVVADAEARGEAVDLSGLRHLLRADGIGLVAVTPSGRVATLVKGRLGARFPGSPFDRRNIELDPLRDAAAAAGLQDLPRGVVESDLDVEALGAGRVQTGGNGGFVFVAQPLTGHPEGVGVVVATRHVGLVPFGRLGPPLLAAAAGGVAAATALSLWLAGRLAEEGVLPPEPRRAEGDA